MRQCEAALLAEDIASMWTVDADADAALLDVATSDSEHASDVLSEQLAEELHRRAAEAADAPVDKAPLLLQPAFAFGLGMAALTMAFFWVSGGAVSTNPWFVRGALVASTLQTGQWYRLVTAATLHAGVGHALGNAAFFVFLGWAAAERFGAGMTAAVWLLTAVGGFVVSLLFSDIAVTLGASGGLFGLLGAAAGHGIKTHRRYESRRRHRLRTLGAAVLLLAFTAFSARANIYAHVGGFVCGLVLGMLLPRRPLSGWLQALLALCTLATVVSAWAAA